MNHQDPVSYLMRALAIKEKALPPDHPSIAITLENYASLLRELKRTEEAATLEQRAKTIRGREAFRKKKPD